MTDAILRTEAGGLRESRARADREEVPGRLRWANLAVGLVHVAQAAAILGLSNSFALPVTASFLGDQLAGGAVTYSGSRPTWCSA